MAGEFVACSHCYDALSRDGTLKNFKSQGRHDIPIEGTARALAHLFCLAAVPRAQ